MQILLKSGQRFCYCDKIQKDFMTNKEKKEFISCLTLRDDLKHCYPNEIATIRDVLSKSPKTLFKYRPFDKYAFPMIKEKYVYLSPVEHLDDPFDCLSDFDTSKMVKGNRIKDSFLEHIFNSIPYNKSKRSLDFAKKHFKEPFDFGNPSDEKKLRDALLKEGVVSEGQVDWAVDYLRSCSTLSDVINGDKVFDDFGRSLLNVGKTTGVCSLSEINDNKVMWSLYGKEYRGYCIEYSIKNTREGRRFLFPVIYSREPNNNFGVKTFESLFADYNRKIPLAESAFSLDQPIDNVGSIYELYCTKDIDWRFQKEWRIIGKPCDHFKEIEIKAVYLGFKVTKTNEEKMIRYAKRQNFSVYKMKAPTGNKKIRFVKVV